MKWESGNDAAPIPGTDHDIGDGDLLDPASFVTENNGA